MWRIEEEKLKEGKALHMKSYKESQRKDVLSLKERKIVGTVENLVIWRKIASLKKKKQGDGSDDDGKEANVKSNDLQDALILCLDNANDSWVIDS